MDRKEALILGAGPVGLTVGRELTSRGLRVRFVTRSGRPVDLAGTETRAADIRDSSALARAAAGAQVIVHAVGVPYQRWARDLPAMQSAVLAAAEQTGAVAVFVENLYSYAADRMPLTEATPEVPPTKKGAIRYRLSAQWLEACQAGKVKAVSVRASDYFGPGATRSGNSHFGARFFPDFEKGKPVAFLGDPDAFHGYTYLPDFGRALADVALDPGAWGKIWICPTMAPTTARTVAELFGTEAGFQVKAGALPRGLVRALGVFDPMVREVVEMLYQFEKEFTADGSALEARYGWEATDLVVAVKQTWAHHRNLSS